MNVIPDTFYERILFILKFKHISLVEFYQTMHLAKSTVQNWKKNKIPAGDTLINLAKYLDVLPEWLIYGKTDCNSSEKVSQSIIVSRIYYRLQELTNLHENDELFFAPLDDENLVTKLFLWNYGIQRIDYETLIYISEKINMSLDKLIANKYTANTNNEKITLINKQEEYLIKYNRLLSPEGRKSVYEHNYATFIKEQYDKHSKKDDGSIFTDDWDPFEDPNFDGNAFVY